MKNLILLALLGFFSCKEVSEKQQSSNSTQSVNLESIIENEIDPICDMSVREHVADTALINGKIWGFCSVVCKEKYIHSKK